MANSWVGDPKTWQANDYLLASDFNTEFRDRLDWLKFRNGSSVHKLFPNTTYSPTFLGDASYGWNNLYPTDTLLSAYSASGGGDKWMYLTPVDETGGTAHWHSFVNRPVLATGTVTTTATSPQTICQAVLNNAHSQNIHLAWNIDIAPASATNATFWETRVLIIEASAVQATVGVQRGTNKYYNVGTTTLLSRSSGSYIYTPITLGAQIIIRLQFFLVSGTDSHTATGRATIEDGISA